MKITSYTVLCRVIGVSLSEPHTRESGAEISVRMYVCLLVPVGLRAGIAGQNVRVSMAEQLLTPSQQVTGSIPGNDMLFIPQDLSSAMYTHARQLPVQNTAALACTALQDLYEVRP